MIIRELNINIKFILFLSPTVPLYLYYYNLYDVAYYEKLLVIICFFQFLLFCSISYLNAQYSYRIQFLKQVFLDLSILVFIFSINYWVLFKISEGSAFHPKEAFNFIDFVYFSIITFATVGYGDIYVTSTYGRIIVSLEILSYLIILVFIVANFKDLKNENS